MGRWLAAPVADRPAHDTTTFVAVDDELDETIGDVELTALALAADPDQPVDADAVPFTTGSAEMPGLLPAWYMPVPTAAGRTRSRRLMFGVLVLAFLVINGAGLCVTYGLAEIAW
jgi:hypothetical protein